MLKSCDEKKCDILKHRELECEKGDERSRQYYVRVLVFILRAMRNPKVFLTKEGNDQD